MTKRGVLYFVWGELGGLLDRSIASLKKTNPHLPYHVVKLPDDSTYLDKARMYEASPYDTTLYLDADTVIFGNLDFGFEQAERFGVACCVNESPWARRYGALADKGDIVEYNAGVVFFDKVKSKPLFDAWTACVREIDSTSCFKTPEGMKRQVCNDQAGMAKAFDDLGFNPFVLPVNWNVRPFWHRAFVGPIKIWHDYAEAPSELEVRSQQAEKSRVFDNVRLADEPDSMPQIEAAENVKISWAMSVPRLGFQDNFFCGSEISAKYGIYPRRYCGAFWGQCLERTMTDLLDADWIFCTDFDSVFKIEDFDRLCSLMLKADFADAIAGVQLRRHDHSLLCAIKKDDGSLNPELTIDKMAADLLQCDIAHFGLTMIRTSALKKMEHPWFLNVPNKEGLWEDGKQDEDIYFWRKWKSTQNSLYIAPRVTVGHIEALITWPNKEAMEPIFQAPTDFWKDGKPKEVWV